MKQFYERKKNIERGLYFSDVWIPEKNIDGYDYIYYGNEFCINKILTLSRLESVINYCRKYGKVFCFLTPPIPESSFEEFISILDYICLENIKTEIIINDYGLINKINQTYSGKFELTFGRLLNRIKKSPSISNYFNKMNNDSKIALQTSAINNQYSYGILDEFGFKNLQYENVVQMNNIPLDNKYKKHLLYPYVQVSTSRKCIGTCINSDTYYINSCCDNSCEKIEYILYNKDIKQEIILIGNTIMYLNYDLPNNITNYSRIVYNRRILSWNDIWNANRLLNDI